MKAKGWLIIMVFLSLILVLFSECKNRAGDIGWSANIEIVDGIKVITNPVESKYGEFDFILEEDLAIGDVNNEDYFFPRRVTLSVDNNGNIFVCDGGNSISKAKRENEKNSYCIFIFNFIVELFEQLPRGRFWY